MKQGRFHVVKCNPKAYKGLLFKLSSQTIKSFIYHVNPSLFIKRDSLLLLHSRQNNSVRIVNKMGLSALTTIVSLSEYDSILIQFTPVTQFQSNRLFIQLLKLNGLATTINLESIVKGLRVIKSSVAQSEVSSTIMKPYWQKRSDFVRSKFSRLLRYNELADVTSDIRLKRSFIIKFTTSKFLAWKLQVSRSELSTVLNSRLFSSQLTNSLVNWLVVVGFYISYTTAQKAINVGLVLVNGQIITNPVQTMHVGDIIFVKPSELTSQVNGTSIIDLSELAVVNKMLGSVIISKLLTNVSQFEILQRVPTSSVVVALQNPINLLLIRSKM